MKQYRQLIYYYGLMVAMLWLSTGYSYAQQPVDGKVLDKSSVGIEGVSISIEGESLASTDATGAFRIPKPAAGSVLVFSSVGYQRLEVTYGGQTSLTLMLQDDNTALDEVVVVGYGTQRKKDLTGAVASVAAKDIGRIQVSGFDRALQGQVAGLQISSTSGAPGTGNTAIQIRGIGSISGGQSPLFVIDGFPVSNAGVGNPLNTINPNDIESVDVLKDASATAIYGSRGANGVIIITTKKGKQGVTQLSFETYMGFQEAAKTIELMNARQFAEFVIDGRNNGWLENGGANAKITDPNSVRPASYRIPEQWADLSNLPIVDVDWQDVIFRRAPLLNYQLSASGGNDKIRYAVSGNYFKQDGIVINSKFDRYTTKFNLDADLTNRLKVGVSLLPSYSATDAVPSSGHYGSDFNIILQSWAMPPLTPIYREDGSLSNTLEDYTDVGYVLHPLLVRDEVKSTTSQFRLLGNIFAEYAISNSLKLKSTFGTDYNGYQRDYFKSSKIASNAIVAPASATADANRDLNWLNENTLTYTYRSNNHSLDAVGGFTIQKSYQRVSRLNATNFADDLIQNVAGGQITGGTYSINEWSLVSVLGRVNYSYLDRYLLTATLRSDGSSRFGRSTRWGAFPSASVGYRISEEPFLRDIKAIDDIKLRFSYGLAGNNAIGNYRYLGLLSNSNYVWGNSEVPGLRQSSFTNDFLGWERSKMYDAGLDISLFNNRLNFAVDYYKRWNSGMLMNRQISAITGYTSAWVNLGELENKGVEFTVGGTPVRSANFTWTSNFNISFNRNKVIQLSTADQQLFADGGRGNFSLTVVGRPIGSFYGHIYDGIFLTEEELTSHALQNGARLGDIRFRDVDGDERITDNDRDFIGNPQPKFYGGFNNSFTYKNWSLDIFLNGTYGNDVFWAGAQFVSNFAGVQTNLADVYENYWRSPENPGDGKTPRVARGAKNNNARFSSYYLYDGSFLRVRNVMLSYSLPQPLTNRMKMQGVRLFLTGANLFTFTRYPGYDPEISNTGDDPLSAGVDYAGYPVARSFTFGFNVTF